MSWLTTHVLDTTTGKPAAGMIVRCEIQRAAGFAEVVGGITDSDGRLQTLFASQQTIEPGTYRLTFETERYFAERQVKSFYPAIQILFIAEASQAHYHVPLLLSPFGYTTYRGS